MEPLALVLVNALATKAFEKIGEKTGESVAETATSLIKSLFNPDELISLNLSPENLSQAIAQEELMFTLQDRLTNNPNIAKQLQDLVNSLKDKGLGENGNFGGQINHGKVINNVGNIDKIVM